MKLDWIEPTNWPRLERTDLHCWLAHLPSQRALLAEADAVLSADERERIGRFRLEAHRERSLLARALLRWILAAYLRLEPAAIALRYGPQGKPALASSNPLHFNTSHAGDYAAFAVTSLGEVGVDIEVIQSEMPRREEIAARYFAAGEQAALRALPEAERNAAFFELWTRKEAFVKARGDGLFSGLDTFEISLGEPRVLALKGDAAAAREWKLFALPTIHGLSGAAIVKAPAVTPRFWKWSPALRER
jgi:4'-phosphopantetheinyl transferase